MLQEGKRSLASALLGPAGQERCTTGGAEKVTIIHSGMAKHGDEYRAHTVVLLVPNVNVERRTELVASDGNTENNKKTE
ncbi:hypothetical protein GRJ2_001625400 [Grus japonensis]|uniref:Uncharacterized protein n=1 Tax=Grus japonensis TaxID=30415 RepID=A0ABC9X2C8_GRUJA